MKKTIAVIFGGQSTEHDISIVTALSAIIKPLELGGHKVVPVYIAKDGAWYSGDVLKNIELYSSGEIDNFCQKAKKISLLFEGGLTLIKPGLRSEKTKIDVVFPATHGTYGEDGSLMGVLRMAGVPFVGCDMPASVIAMDKVLAKQVVTASSIPTPKYKSFNKTEFIKNSKKSLEEINKNLNFPLFVKPAHLGSSIGITKVNKKEDLQNALEVALHYDDRALAEEAVGNLVEVTVPIMGNHELTPGLVEQPLAKEDEFFDFETKYLHGGKKKGGAKTKGAQGYSELPAKLEGNLYNKALDTAKSAYRAVGCQGIARVDLLIDEKTKQVYFNEINPLPGSLYAHNWRQAGVSSVQLVTKLVELAEEAFAEKNQLEAAFATNFLKQF